MGWPKGKPRRKAQIIEPALDPTVLSESLGPVDDQAARPTAVESPSDPPLSARRALDWQQHPELAWVEVRCRECNGEMFTKDPKRCDVCEECAWLMFNAIKEQQQAQVQRATGRLVNPFTSHDPFRELGGSLPSVKTR